MSTFVVLTVQNPSLVIFTVGDVNSCVHDSRFLSNDLHERDSRILSNILNTPNLKAVAFSIVDNQEHKDIYKIKLRFREFCDKNNIKCVFLMNDLFDITAALLAANLDTKYGDVISIVIANENRKVVVYTVAQDVADCRILSRQIFTPSFISKIQEEALTPNKPTKIIVAFQHPLGALSYWKLTKPTFDLVYDSLCGTATSIIDRNINECMPQSYVFTILAFINEKYHKFSIKPVTFENVGVIDVSKADNDHIFSDSEILVSLYKSLPVTRICILRLTHDLVVCHYQHLKLKCLETIKASEYQNQRVSITLTIDRNAFYQIKVESIGNKIIDAFVTFSDKTFTLKVPNYSTPHLTNIPFSLAFVNEKVLIGNETKQLAAEQKSYLIDDFFKLISTVPDSLQHNPSWNFTITSDEKNPILLEFNTFRGKRKAPLIALLVLIINWSMNQIQSLSGVKPAYCIFYGNLNEYSKANLLSACNNLGIDANFEVN